jgi:hypothetical protein
MLSPLAASMVCVAISPREICTYWSLFKMDPAEKAFVVSNDFGCLLTT